MALRAGLVAAVLVLALGALVSAQQGDAAIPPLSYTCPHHADHVQDNPGTCPMPMEGAPGDAALKGDRLPLRATVKVKFDPSGREYRFDFAFTEHSIESGAKR